MLKDGVLDILCPSFQKKFSPIKYAEDRTLGTHIGGEQSIELRSSMREEFSVKSRYLKIDQQN